MDQQQAQDKAQQLQKALKEQKFVVDKDGVHISMRGDLLVEELTLNGQPYNAIMEAMNEALGKGKELAGQTMASVLK